MTRRAQPDMLVTGLDFGGKPEKFFVRLREKGDKLPESAWEPSKDREDGFHWLKDSMLGDLSTGT